MAIDAVPSPTQETPATSAVPRSASARDRLDLLFAPVTGGSRSWLHRRRGVIAIAVAVVVVLVATLLVATRAFGAGEAGFRTATAGHHDVDALQTGVATIEPVAQASVAFPAAGTVATVPVKVGDRVAAGQTLATLDPAALERALREKQAALAQAELTLERALNGEDAGGTGNRPSGGSSGADLMARTAGTTNEIQLVAAVTSPPGAPASGGDGSLRAAQQAVLDAQRAVDGALHTAAAKTDAAANVCAAAGVGGDGTTTPTPEALAACQTAMQAVSDAQQAVNAAQQHLASASSALDAILQQQAAAAGDGTSHDGTGGTGATAPSGGSGATGPSAGASPSSGASSPSSADLVSYQQAVDAAEAQVAVAQQAVGQATIVSPIAGTVEAVNLAPGDAVTAASTTSNVLVVGPDGFEATTTVSVDDVAHVKVGQSATVVPDGSKRALAGTVTAVSVAPVDTSSTPIYRVVIGLADPHAALDNGATATAAIVTEQAHDVLSVPTSAVTTTGNRHFVTVLDGTKTSRVAVTVGVAGDRWTEIRTGLRAGQAVVLADLGEPLPGTATDSATNGGRGRLPGGGAGFAPPGGATFRFGGR